jgi:alpha-tubulin suppressor-like RCC1 family protein
MNAKRALSIASVLALLVIAACSDEATGDRPAFVEDAGSDAASPVDDAGSTTPDADARAPFDAAAPAIACAAAPCFTRIVAGPTHYCAVANDGSIRCWGNPTALGDFASGPAAGATPVVLQGIANVTDIGASALSTCVVRADGGVDCFGKDRPQPVRVAPGIAAKRLALGDTRSCLVTTADELWCWGDSESTGKGDAALALANDKASAAVMTAPVGYAIGASGALFSWGADDTMLGRDTSLTADWTPALVAGLPPALQVAASDQHVCALALDGRLFCWGHDDNGALGLGSFRTVATPTEVFFGGVAWPAQIAVAVTHSCARMSDATLTCWARVNASGELGRPELTGVYVPTNVSLTKPVAAVATGIGSTCILATDGSIQCWGDNAYGQLGLGARDTGRHPVPTTVVFP